jgi:hypothetical protein
MPERCGANFRKPVSQISDRAKRYRAHSPGCRPDGLKACYKCGSRRNVVIGHIDGDESNGRKSNLRWECKRHNTIHGKAMAKQGRGVRTRQYNPGAKTLGAYVDAAVNHTRGAHDAGGRVIHETPKAKRREFAREIAFRKRHNPDELPEDEKATHSAVRYVNPSQIPGQHCSNCVHYIKGEDGEGPRCEGVKSPIQARAWCKNFVRIGKNPGEQTEADKLYRKFHGRGPDAIYETMRKGIDPYGEHPELTSLGPLIRLVVGEDVELSDQGEVEDSEWDNELNFVPMAEYRRRCERLDTKNPDQVREFRRWLRETGVPDVAGVPPNGQQLYFPGGQKQLSDADLERLGSNPAQDVCDLGYCFLIEYFAQKRFDRFEPTTYFHQFGEKTGVRPRLIYFKVPKMLFLAGGEYVVKSVGIDN